MRPSELSQKGIPEIPQTSCVLPASPATTTTAPTTSTKRATAPTTGLLRLGLVNRQGTALQLIAIKPRDRRLPFLGTPHFDKPTPPGSARHLVRAHIDRRYRTCLAEQPLPAWGGGIKGKISHKQLRC